MTQRTNARVAGFAFLFYIAVGVTQMVLSSPTHADSTTARLALIARHAWRIRVNIVLTLVICATAVVLAAALYGITRGEDPDLAILGLAFRAGEGVLAGIGVLTSLGVVASILLVVGLPLRLVEVISGSVAQILWLPMALFEIPLGFWLLLKGVRHAPA
jgi:hypothetical protein